MSDFVIIGAGAAGCVLAGRLSEDPSASVVLLEAGGSNRKLEVYLPAAFSKLFKTTADWAYFTEPEPELGGRRLFWPRGKMIGGSSSMNAMIYIRGVPSDYDAWAAAGCNGWGYKDILPYFRKSERNERGKCEYHGDSGPFRVCDLRAPSELSHAFLTACAESGLPRNDDFNGARQEGFGTYQVNQSSGRRFSAADAFLAPARRRRNLKVVTGARATRLLFERGRCVGVEYVKDGKKVRQMAAREVLLAGGAINSPHLLMTSGIGPADDLRKLKIDVVADLPGVGKNLQDHAVCVLTYSCAKPVTLDVAETLPNVVRFALGRGPLTSNVGEAGLFFKTRAGLPDPDIQALFAPAWFVNHGLTKPEGCGFSLGATLLRPDSRGELRLRSAEPRDPPRIFARYLSSPRDRATLVEGVKRLREIVGGRALASYRGPERSPGDAIRTDADVARYVGEALETLYHPVGTCKMGTGPDAVVDPDLRVRGVAGLRVVDASIMPTIPGGNTQAPTLMIAERGALFAANA